MKVITAFNDGRDVGDHMFKKISVVFKNSALDLFRWCNTVQCSGAVLFSIFSSLKNSCLIRIRFFSYKCSVLIDVENPDSILNNKFFSGILLKKSFWNPYPKRF